MLTFKLIASDSLALSVKMSILLYLPAVAVILLKRHGLLESIKHLFVVVLIQVGLGSRFLLNFPWEYLKGSFDFSRQFLYKWTVNWKMLSETTFLSSHLAYGLLVCHVSTLLLVVHFYWCRSEGGISGILISAFRHPRTPSLMAPMTSEGMVYSFSILE
jgi:alpha-1,3-mannosyltransferase